MYFVKFMSGNLFTGFMNLFIQGCHDFPNFVYSKLYNNKMFYKSIYLYTMRFLDWCSSEEEKNSVFVQFSDVQTSDQIWSPHGHMLAYYYPTGNQMAW